MGFEPEFELEKLLDEPGYLAKFLIDDNRNHFCSVQKAVVLIARMQVLLNLDDIRDTVSFRCPECSKCLTCKKSQRSTAVSLQGVQEQVIIEQSVKICEENNTVIAKYPFLKDPVEFLTARHNNSNNYNQALKVYKGQCRKSEKQREGMRLVHQELVEKNFMKKLNDCDEDIQNFIKDTAFPHYNPWRIVLKKDSISIPVRMVVDPTMTTFNLLNYLTPVCSRDDAEKLLKSITLTRRTILAKVAKFYDPCGFWEPIKLQIKLAMLPLKGLDWNEKIPELEQTKWSEILPPFV